jgi:hypothetical protein
MRKRTMWHGEWVLTLIKDNITWHV